MDKGVSEHPYGSRFLGNPSDELFLVGFLDSWREVMVSLWCALAKGTSAGGFLLYPRPADPSVGEWAAANPVVVFG